MFLAFPYFVNLLCDFIHFDPTQKLMAADKNLAYVLAAFHTGFNLCNAALFIGLVNPLERLATRWVAKPRHNDEEESQLRFITKGMLDTPEQSVMEARKEIINYADTVTKMFTQTRFLFSVSNETEFKNIFTLVEHYEDICDEMEVDIANYLNKVCTEEPSADLKRAICGMLREVAEIESIGDSCHPHRPYRPGGTIEAPNNSRKNSWNTSTRCSNWQNKHWNKCEPSYPSGKPRERLLQPTI